MMKLRLLDLFCGAGGAATGYHRAGFEVVGIDIKPQLRYPFEFHQADALEFPLRGFDVIHASPPCQAYSQASACRPGLAGTHPRLIEVIRERCTSMPYIIENVKGARSSLRNPIELCGAQFGLPSYRHRYFESSIPLSAPDHLPHTTRTSRAGHWTPGTFVCVAGNCAPIALVRVALGIDWMRRDELREAIPPIYTEYIGRQVYAYLRAIS